MATQREKTVVYAAGRCAGHRARHLPRGEHDPLLDAGVELPTVCALAAIVAAVMGGWSFVVARRRPSPASLHTQLGHGAG